MSTQAIVPDPSTIYDSSAVYGAVAGGSDPYTVDYTPVVPSSDALGAAMAAAAGVPFVPTTSGPTADPSGISAINYNAAVNPTPTGGWMQTAQSILNAATKGFSTFTSGSPSAAIPAARNSLGKSIGGPLTTSTGATNWPLIALILAGAGIGIWALVKYA